MYTRKPRDGAGSRNFKLEVPDLKVLAVAIHHGIHQWTQNWLVVYILLIMVNLWLIFLLYFYYSHHVGQYFYYSQHVVIILNPELVEQALLRSLSSRPRHCMHRGSTCCQAHLDEPGKCKNAGCQRSLGLGYIPRVTTFPYMSHICFSYSS